MSLVPRTTTRAPAPLSPAALAAAPQALSANTLRAYRRQAADVDRRLRGRPLDDEGLSEVLADMTAEGLGAATLGQAAAAVRYTARLMGSPDPVGPSCSVVLAAARRASGAQRQAVGIDWGSADAVAAVAAAGGDPAGLRDAALIALMSDCLLRVGEAVALDGADIDTLDDGTGRVTVRRSKTDQESRGAVLFVGAPTMARIADWLDAARIEDGPLFVRVHRCGQVLRDHRITTRTAARIIEGRSAAAGIEGASGHSLRVGSAQSLVRSGGTLAETMQVGRWQSSAMVSRYSAAELAGRGAVARLRYGG